MTSAQDILRPEFFKELLDHLAEGVYFVDRERRILYWNRTAEAITGYRAEELIGRFCFDNILDHIDRNMCSLCLEHCPLDACMRTGVPSEDRIFLRRRDGHRLPVTVKVAPIRGGDGTVIGAVEVFADASGEMEVEEINQNLQRLIRIDSLTQIPNRLAMREAIEREIQRFRRYGTPFAVAFADIDHFKAVNDTYGHLIGDHALQWFAQVLGRNLRKADLIGRYGGEEFLLLLTATGAEQAWRIAEKLRQRLAAKTFPETGSTITSSFGVADIRLDDTWETLVARADAALYRAKEAGRNRVVLDESTAAANIEGEQ